MRLNETRCGVTLFDLPGKAVSRPASRVGRFQSPALLFEVCGLQSICPHNKKQLESA
jgi:hypothetical protein